MLMSSGMKQAPTVESPTALRIDVSRVPLDISETQDMSGYEHTFVVTDLSQIVWTTVQKECTQHGVRIFAGTQFLKDKLIKGEYRFYIELGKEGKKFKREKEYWMTQTFEEAIKFCIDKDDKILPIKVTIEKVPTLGEGEMILV